MNIQKGRLSPRMKNYNSPRLDKKRLSKASINHNFKPNTEIKVNTKNLTPLKTINLEVNSGMNTAATLNSPSDMNSPKSVKTER